MSIHQEQQPRLFQKKDSAVSQPSRKGRKLTMMDTNTVIAISQLITSICAIIALPLTVIVAVLSSRNSSKK